MAEKHEWPGHVPNNELFPKTTFKDFEEHIHATAGFHEAMTALGLQPSQREEFRRRLFNLYRSRQWEGISAAQMRQAIKAFRDAMRHTIALRNSELVRQTFGRKVIADQLRRELQWVVARLQSVPDISKKKTPRTDKALAATLRHVYNSTGGRYRYKQLAGVLTVTLGETWTAQNLRKQRERLADRGYDLPPTPKGAKQSNVAVT